MTCNTHSKGSRPSIGFKADNVQSTSDDTIAGEENDLLYYIRPRRPLSHIVHLSKEVSIDNTLHDRKSREVCKEVKRVQLEVVAAKSRQRCQGYSSSTERRTKAI